VRHRSSTHLLIAAALAMTVGAARAHDESKYPDWSGQWVRVGPGWFDPTKPAGRGQQAPLTPEYQAIFEASLADQTKGGQGNDPTIKCIPSGMPRAMIVTQPMELVITPKTTYVMLELHSMLRRIYTDGRGWPDEIEPQFMGYAIGHWEDTAGDGRFDTLAVETRHIKGPHAYDNSGLPFHKDGQLVVRERISLDKADANILNNQITVIDNALTRPWTVTRKARRETKKVSWSEYICNEDNHHVTIGNENYMVNADGYLMPVKKDQPPPDLRFFNQTRQ
jgi:hypothetical protein